MLIGLKWLLNNGLLRHSTAYYCLGIELLLWNELFWLGMYRRLLLLLWLWYIVIIMLLLLLPINRLLLLLLLW